MKIRGTNKNSKSAGALMRWLPSAVASLLGIIVLSWMYGLYSLIQDPPSSVRTSDRRVTKEEEPATAINKIPSRSIRDEPFCAFRRYPPHRFYDLKEPLDFLVNDEYIYGEWPILLEASSPRTKFCVDQTEWLPATNKDRIWPFADGTNPSILSMKRIRDRGASAFADKIQQLYGTTSAWVVTICMTNSQCTWNDTEESRRLFDMPDLKQTSPNTVRTLLQVYTKDYTLLGEKTIYLLRDAPWGKKHAKADNSWQLPALDDARLFLFDAKVYLSFREGPGFGYHSQVLQPLHLEEEHAYVQASESCSMCCGRNMALIDAPDNTLKALTWVDPVTIEAVDPIPGHHAKQPRKTKEQRQEEKKLVKSHIHGTNGYMIPISENELLGVAHFHRPNDRNTNPYARFGHHYTHAFYVVVSNDGGQHLKALSPEFLLGGSEIIQFISGLEFDGTTVTLAYGINDCEAAVVSLDWKTTVQPLLRNVPAGQQVVNLMAKLKNPPISKK